jgi:hypothetical protein
MWDWIKQLFWIRCSFCKKKCSDVRLYRDPYESEINERNVTVAACGECIEDRAEEV